MNVLGLISQLIIIETLRLTLISPMISNSKNILLCEIPSPLVIKETLFGIQSLKSLGPDGLPLLFYKKTLEGGWAISY